MPYIKQKDRGIWAPSTPGELNFQITKMVDAFIQKTGGVNYTNLNTAVGVLECAKLELYRRIAAPYEEVKMGENGDVYTCDKRGN